MKTLLTIVAILTIAFSMAIVGMNTINTVESTFSGHMAMIDSIN